MPSRNVIAHRLRLIYGVVFALSIPVLLIATNLRYVASEPKVYESGFVKYGAESSLGVDRTELDRIGRELIAYFNSQRETPQVEVTMFGQSEPLFSREELVHLEDIKGLLGLGRRIWLITLLVSSGYVAFLFLRWRAGAWPALARATLAGSALTVFLGVALAVSISLNFDWMFLQFHYVSFSNAFWQLTCPPNNLACLFQPGFFYDATKLLAAATGTEAIAAGAVAGTYLWMRRRKANSGRAEESARPAANDG